MTSKSGPDAASAPQFLERMFSGIVQPGEVRRLPAGRPAEQLFRPLRETKAGPGASYRLQSRASDVRVQADSRAIDVMTDLRKTAAVVTRGHATLDEAHQAMIAHGVRALFVVDERDEVVGILTSTDLLGEKPILFAQQRGIRHDEVLVRDLMTPADALEAMSLDEVLQARVGDVVASLKQSGRQHALVVEPTSGSVILTVRGIFSLTQIARQLGLPPQSGHDVARTFAEIEAAIGA